jgi:hypothetical protein
MAAGCGTPAPWIRVVPDLEDDVHDLLALARLGRLMVPQTLHGRSPIGSTPKAGPSSSQS